MGEGGHTHRHTMAQTTDNISQVADAVKRGTSVLVPFCHSEHSVQQIPASRLSSKQQLPKPLNFFVTQFIQHNKHVEVLYQRYTIPL